MLGKRSCLCVMLMFLLLTTPIPTALAQRQADSSLEGLTTIHVRVQLKSDSDGKSSGLRQEQLEGDAEGLLADSGMKVIPQEEFDRLLRSRGYPVALFDIDARITKLSGTELHIYNFNFKVRQAVLLVRKPVIKFLAPTWEFNSLGTTDSLPALREKVKEVVAQFLQDFKAENPK